MFWNDSKLTVQCSDALLWKECVHIRKLWFTLGSQKINIRSHCVWRGIQKLPLIQTGHEKTF